MYGELTVLSSFHDFGEMKQNVHYENVDKCWKINLLLSSVTQLGSLLSISMFPSLATTG